MLDMYYKIRGAAFRFGGIPSWEMRLTEAQLQTLEPGKNFPGHNDRESFLHIWKTGRDFSRTGRNIKIFMIVWIIYIFLGLLRETGRNIQIYTYLCIYIWTNGLPVFEFRPRWRPRSMQVGVHDQCKLKMMVFLKTNTNDCTLANDACDIVTTQFFCQFFCVGETYFLRDKKHISTTWNMDCLSHGIYIYKT